ncbi:MAG: WD40/YVTN/BNR-like repeat-containing protein, partial [Anaerolineae bacterium]
MSTAKRIISKNWIASTTNPEQKTNVSFLHYVVFTCVYLVLISPVFWTYDVFAQYEGWVQKGPSTIFIIEDQAITGIGTQIAVGESGHVMKTTDGGENWTNLVSGTTTDLHAISIPVGDIGYVVGNLGKIICTTSAGMNWFDLNSGTAKNLYGVFFTDDSTGTAVGENGTIIKTTDWGTTWNPQNSGINKILYDVYAIDQQKAVAVGEGGIILRTENGGADWSQQVSGTTEDLLAVDGHGDNKLIVSGNKGVILHSISAGMTWTPRVSGTLVHLPDVILLDEPFAAVVGHDGTILRTKDGGITWVPQESGTTENLLSVAFYDKNHGSAAGENGTVLYTRTGGKTLPIIFVDNSKPNGNGRFTNPFDNLADALNAADSTRAVWVSKGSGVYAGGMTLKERQTVLGQGVDLKYGNEILIPAATAPIITNQNGDGVRLGKKTMLEGFQIDNCNGAGIFVGPDVVDTVLVANTTITRGKRGIEIDGSSGKLIFSNVDIVKMDGPSFRLLDSGGLGTNGQITQSTSAATVEIQDHRGTVNFTAGSTINASNGNGLQFNNADGKYSFIGLSVLNKGHGRIEIIGGSSGTFTFDDLTITDSRDVGIRIDGSDGVFEFGKVSISNTDSVAVSIRNSSADVTFKKLDIDSALVGVKIDSLAGKFAITGDGTLGSGGRIQD